MSAHPPEASSPVPRSNVRNPQSAIRKLESAILLGPTGAGKTPLGAALEQHGLWGQRCCHFDFGEHLRRVAASPAAGSYGLTQEERGIVVRSVETGALLEDDQFPIAGKMLESVIARKRMAPHDRLVLNGLPRHVGQARAVDACVSVTLLVYLECDARTVVERIRTNMGGDRHGRRDDAIEAVTQRLDLFRERTLPLLDHYRQKKVRIENIAVGVDTSAADILSELETRLP